MAENIRPGPKCTPPTDALLNAIPDHAVAVLDPNGIVTHWNVGAQQIQQYVPEEIIGRHFSHLYTESEQTAGEPERALKEAIANKRYIREGWRVRKDTSRFWASVIIETLYDENRTIIGFVKTVRDETGRKRSEEALQRATAALMQAQKMEAVGQLTGGVAHDFNNLQTVIVNSLDFLSRSVQQPREARLIEIAQQAASRGSKLTQQLLAFSRRQPLHPDVCNLNDVISGFENVLRRACGETIEVTIKLAPTVKTVEIDTAQFEAALLNLAVNARDAMPSGGRLDITTYPVAIRQIGNPDGRTMEWCSLESCPFSGGHSSATTSDSLLLNDIKFGYLVADLNEGEYVLVSISDTGEGIPPHILERVFDPFFTTKDVGKGTGLGLSQVYGFVTQSGGHISIDSTEGAGTIIRIYLPVTNQVPRSATDTEDAKAPHHIGGLVLIVEDEIAVRDVAVQLFGDMGFSTLAAADGPSAIEILQDNQAIDLLFSDIVMPKGMSGLELAQYARQLRPDLKIILASGYPTKTLLAENTDRNIEFIKKPYRIGDLLETLKQLD